MRKLAIALALMCASSAAMAQNPWKAGHKALAHSEPCTWHPRKGADVRFLTCAGVEGPVSETIGEFGGTREFKPWILITGNGRPSDPIPRVTLWVVPTGVDNSPEGEDNPRAFEVTDVPIEWLPSGAGVHDAFALTEQGFRLLATFRK